MEAKSPYQVVVVGAGPAGLTLVNLLGAQGVRVLLVERNPATVSEPRAVSIDDESLRTMQAAGLVETVLSQVVAGYGSEYYTPAGRPFLRVAPTGQPYGYPRRNAFRQPILEAQLREGLARFPNVTTLFSTALREFEQSNDSVRVQLLDAKGLPGVVGCEYLIACDGAASTVRTKLGIKLQGKTFQERWLIVDLDNSPAPSRHTMVFCDAGRPCIALPGPNGTRRYEFKLHAHESAEEMLKPQTVSALLTRHGAAPESTLTRKVVYTFHARIAERWSSGRVFLAGDAAHLTPPFAGQGMNSGIRDAHNLAWKLAAVVQGRMGPRLLESYEKERCDHVREMIQLALRMGRIMGPANRYFGWITQTAFRALGVWPRVRDYFGEMKYKPKPRFSSGFLIPDVLSRRTTLVGRLLPQPLVTPRSGVPTLLDEVLGCSFALLCDARDLPAFQTFAQHPAWNALGCRLVAVAAPGAVSTGTGDVEIVVDGSKALLLELARYRGRALLIRPDHYVAASFHLSDPNVAVSSLAPLLEWNDKLSPSFSLP